MGNNPIIITILFSILASLCMAGDATEISVNSIDDRCVGEIFYKIGDLEPSFGNVFLVLGIEVINHGPDNFYVDPNYFSIKRDGIQYSNSYVTNFLRIIGHEPLESVSLAMGKTASGYLCFEIPAGDNRNNIEYTGKGGVGVRDYECNIT